MLLASLPFLSIGKVNPSVLDNIGVEYLSMAYIEHEKYDNLLLTVSYMS